MTWEDVSACLEKATLGSASGIPVWETAAKLAPLGTALLACIAAGIAIWAIFAQRDIARRRAAIDFFLKTEMDKDLLALYDVFKEKASIIRSLPNLSAYTTTPEYKEIRKFLNICELIAVGVNEKAFSNRVSYSYWGDILLRGYRDAERLINHVRRDAAEGTMHTYIDLERLCKKWKQQ